MLKRIQISNFKAIGETPLILDNLAPVNYLVGPNGCGKSSVLEYLYLSFLDKENKESPPFLQNNKKIKNKLIFNENILYIDSRIDLFINSFFASSVLSNKCYHQYKTEEEFVKDQVIYFWEFYNYLFLDTIKYASDGFGLENTTLDNEKPIIGKRGMNGIFKIHTNINHLKFIKTEFKNTSQGLNKIQSYCWIFNQFKNIKKPIDLVLIEEPENFLHPEKHKQFVSLINEVSKWGKEGLQFLISTHSPFIISAAGEVGDQNVYVIKEGQCLNPEGSKKGGAKRVAFDMLGVGLNDYMPKKIVFCEGNITDPQCKSPNYDEVVLDEIFKFHEDVKFYSSGGYNEVIENLRTANHFIKNIFENQGFIVFCDFDKGEHVDKFNEIKEKYSHITNIKYRDTSPKKELEEFLYSDEIIDKIEIFTKDQKEKIKQTGYDKHAKKKWEEINKMLPKNFDWKNKVFKEKQSVFELEILAKLVTPETQIYKELHNCFFKD
jgi:predicted ATPase